MGKYLKGVIKTVPAFVRREVTNTLHPRSDIGTAHPEPQFVTAWMGNRKERRRMAAEIRKGRI